MKIVFMERKFEDMTSLKFQEIVRKTKYVFREIINK